MTQHSLLAVSLDLPALVVLGVALAAVLLVWWGSRPSVIRRYADPGDDAPPTPKRGAAAPRDPRPEP